VRLVKVGIAVVGAHEAAVDADHVRAAVVLVVAHEDVEVLVEHDVVDVPESRGEDVQVAAVGAAAQDAPALEDEAIPFRPRDVAAAVAEREVEPPVVPGRDAVGAVQAVGALLGRPAQAGEEVAPSSATPSPSVSRSDVRRGACIAKTRPPSYARP
jgi:NADPH:quinone reductase-like Zn-dependent oxidoreductase